VQFIRAHNWFHLAVLYIANWDMRALWSAYRRNIWGFTPDSIAEQTDAILVLWYVEL